MSRFIEILNRFHGHIDLRSFHHILEEMKERLEAEAAHVEMAFSYFMPMALSGRRMTLNFSLKSRCCCL